MPFKARARPGELRACSYLACSSSYVGIPLGPLDICLKTSLDEEQGLFHPSVPISDHLAVLQD
eukprot:scaffold285042_cov17-Tisochrysis_lutea.AAC.1